MVMTKSRPAFKRITRASLREDYSRQSSKPRVDREAGIIYGLKICGLSSDNGRDYLPATLKEAAPLYEGKPCYTDHREDGQTRSWAEDIGLWRGVKFVEGQGLFGDLHGDKLSDDFQRLMGRAESLHENIGFSHDAEGDTEVRDGRLVVTKITEVNSVDIVADPATTRGLFEHKGKAMKKWTFKGLLESVKKTFTGDKLLATKKLLEDDDMVDPLAVEVDEPAGDPEDALSDGFKQGMYACVDAFVAGEMDLGAALGKLKELAKAHDKLVDAGGGVDEEDGEEEEKPVMEADDDEEDDDEEDKKKTESRLARLERREEYRNLCESIDFYPTKADLDDLVKIEDRKTAKRFAESLKAADGKQPKKPDGPRSRGTGGFKEAKELDLEAAKSRCLI